jgi:hypothetical protein
MTHLDEKTLELYVLGAKEVSSQRGEIEDHLRECAGCHALHQEISDYYAEVQALQEGAATADTQALTLRDWIVHARRFEDRAPLRPLKQSLALRAVVLAVRHPVVTSMGFLALLVAALLLSYPRKGPTDLNPAYARAKDEFLVAYNKKGDELWRKHIGTGYDAEKLRTGVPTYEPDKYLVTVDVDGDDKQEVIAAFGLFNGSMLWPMRNSVICYNTDGSARWISKIGRKMSFGNEVFSDDYAVHQILVADPNRNGAVEVLALAGHEPYFPSVIVRLDAFTGRVLNEYWHSGNVTRLVPQDVDGKGNAELVAVGENNGYDMASLAVLDLRTMSGHSPSPSHYRPEGIPAGREKYYLLFSRCDLKRFASHKRNVADVTVSQNDGLLRVGVAERVGNTWYPLLYFFDGSMKCVRVVGEDTFANLHQKLEAEGKLTQKLDAQYYEELRQGIQYWGREKSRFVRYEELSNKSAMP